MSVARRTLSSLRSTSRNFRRRIQRTRAHQTSLGLESVRIHIGSGDNWKPGWVNVDLRQDVSDIVGSVQHLPFRSSAAVEILAEDILEHLQPSHAASVFSEIHRVLIGGGLLTIQIPNLAALAAEILEHSSEPEAAIRNICGGHRWGPEGSWDCHHWGWTPESIARDLSDAGFAVVSNNRARNMRVAARKQ